MKRSNLYSAAAMADAVLVFGGAQAQRGSSEDGGDAADDDVERGAVDCLQLRRIDRSEVIDDRTILFYEHGNRVYQNVLPRQCPGLERERRFTYEVGGSELCSVDTIAVLEERGAGLERAFTCPLGRFYPMTEDDIDELRRENDGDDRGLFRRRRAR